MHKNRSGEVPESLYFFDEADLLLSTLLRKKKIGLS